MTDPQRIQRKRTLFWRKPPGAIYVGRPTRWGNEWRVNPKSATSRRVAVAHYRHWLEAMLATSPAYVADWLAPLRGHDLACWCLLTDADGNRVPCHADVLLELANR